MKILAIEKELEDADWSAAKEILDDEARHVYELYLSGFLREIYFNDEHCAVLMLECENKERATELLNSFPLVKNGLIRFEVTTLNPYTGYERIMK